MLLIICLLHMLGLAVFKRAIKVEPSDLESSSPPSKWSRAVAKAKELLSPELQDEEISNALLVFPRWELPWLLTIFQPLSLKVWEGIRISSCKFECTPFDEDGDPDDKALFIISITILLVYCLGFMIAAAVWVKRKVTNKDPVKNAVSFKSRDMSESGKHVSMSQRKFWTVRLRGLCG